MTRVVGILLIATAAVGCGARTGLDVPTLGSGSGGSAGSGQVEMPTDGGEHTLPNNCEDAGATFIYLVTKDREIYAFDVDGGYAFADHGRLPCVSAAQSMAVDRAGHAYVESSEFRLFSVSLASLASCRETTFVNFGASQFGMAFSSDSAGTGETLFLAGQDNAQNELVSLNLGNFQVTKIGALSENIGEAELTGTGDGRLYAYGVKGPGNTSHLAQVDKQTAAIVSDMALPFQESTAWAFAWWGGAFYFFTSGGGPSVIRRLDPDSGDIAIIAQAPGMVVGAGVSTCAPLD